MSIEFEIRDQEIVKAYASGLTIIEVGEQFNKSSSRVSQILKEQNYPTRSDKLDLTNQRFGRLLVLKEAKKKRKGFTYWLCKCDCGNEVIVKTNCLRNEHTKSCGCYRVDFAAEQFTTHGLSCGGKQSPEYKILHSAKRRAKKANLSFNLDISDIVIPECCPVFPEIKLKCNEGCVDFNSPTLDRIIPELGYIKGNVIIISHKANSIKNSATFEELRRVADWLELKVKLNR